MSVLDVKKRFKEVTDAVEGRMKVQKQGKKEKLVESGRKRARDGSEKESVRPVETDEADLYMRSVKKSNAKVKDLIVSPRSDWHCDSKVQTSKRLPKAQAKELKPRAQALLKEENEVYAATVLPSSRDRTFLSRIISEGTLNDKISALTLMIQESPLHTMRTMEILLNMAKKKSRNQAVASVLALKDLFFSTVLPDRKLKWFEDNCTGDDANNLIAWAYEDWLKKTYTEFLQIVDGLSTDSLPYSRTNMIAVLSGLLSAKPEQEGLILQLLVNKLGDSERKIASKAAAAILQVETAHPAMKTVIVDAVEKLLFRQNVGEHAQYYSMIALNQTVLRSSESELANKLVGIYFTFFQSVLTSWKPPKRIMKEEKMSKKARKRFLDAEKAADLKESQNSKMISAVLTGVNRAFPFANVADDVLDKQVDTLFKITHSGNFNTSIQALLLVWQVSATKPKIMDRFYRALYECLLDFRLVLSNKHSLFLNLLYKAIKADTNDDRIQSFVKRIVQLSVLHSAPFIIGSVYLLSHLRKEKPIIYKSLSAVQDGSEEAYDGRKREPKHANACNSCLWEILPLSKHYHPTVSLYADYFISDKSMPSKPDLASYSMQHFLDRFVYKTAKNKVPIRGSSIMQSLSGGDSNMLLTNTKGSDQRARVNSESFWRSKVSDVPVDEVFFHKFFTQKPPRTGKKQEKTKTDDSDVGEENEVWKALVKSQPDVDADVDVDDDDSMDISDEEVDFDDDEDDLIDLSDDEGMLGSDENVSDTDEEAVEEEEEGEDEEGKDEAEKKPKRQKWNAMPTFASAEDYAHLLEE